MEELQAYGYRLHLQFCQALRRPFPRRERRRFIEHRALGLIGQPAVPAGSAGDDGGQISGKVAGQREGDREFVAVGMSDCFEPDRLPTGFKAEQAEAGVAVQLGESSREPQTMIVQLCLYPGEEVIKPSLPGEWPASRAVILRRHTFQEFPSEARGLRFAQGAGEAVLRNPAESRRWRP